MGRLEKKYKKKKWVSPKTIEFLIKSKTQSGGTRGAEGNSGKGHHQGS